MPKNESDQNPNYQAYLDLLSRLHLMISSGQGESVYADELRDAMDEPWLRLSDSEKNRIRDLSADFNSFELTNFIGSDK